MNIAEVITILLSLTGFGVQASPDAPGAAEVVRLAPERADLVVHLDLAALVPGNHRALTALARKLPAGSEPAVALGRALAELELGRAAVKLATGLDPITDVTSATGFVSLASGEPEVLVVVRGRFPTDLLVKLQASPLGGESFEVDGRAGVALGSMAATKLGKDVVLGHRPWVEARMKKGFRRAAGPGDALLRRALASRPFFAVVATPSDETRKLALGELDGPDAGEALARDLLAGTRHVELHASRTGLGWTVGLVDQAGLERTRLWSEGAFDLLRAEQFFALGAARLGLAVLPALRASLGDAVIDAIEPRQDEILAAAKALIGDGKFTARVALDRAGKQVTAEARARAIGQIIGPVPLLVLAGALVAITRGEKVEASAPAAGAARAPAAPVVRPIGPPGRDRGEVRRPVKARRKPGPVPAPAPAR